MSTTPSASSPPPLRSFAAQSQHYDLDDRRGEETRHYINPIKLKAMAMKMRHRTLGYAFIREEQKANPMLPGLSGAERGLLSAEKIILPTTCSPARSESQKDPSLLEVEGPNNLLGLKTIFMHPFCIPLVCVPLGIMSHFLEWGDAWTFWLNFLALIPLAKILGDATEELAAAISSDAISGLLNATFGNAVEMIVSVQSLRAGLLSVVKASLLGSVLSNILLVLGTAFLVGGLTPSSKRRGRFHSFNDDSWKRRLVGLEKEQKFAIKGALISMAMLLFSCMSFALPTIFNAFPTDDSANVLKVSRIGAWIVMSSYVAFIVFQLLTHTKTLSKEEFSLGSEVQSNGDEDDEEGGEDEESASLTVGCAIGLMCFCTVVVAINSELLVDAIESVVKGCGIPEGFIGVILLPIAGNACEHAAAIRFAMQDRPGLAIGIAVGSSTQVALLVVPFSVAVGWMLGKPLNLDFGALNTSVVTLSVLVVLTLLLDGRSNWLKGYILVALYVFIAVLYWYVPQSFGSDGQALNSIGPQLEL